MDSSTGTWAAVTGALVAGFMASDFAGRRAGTWVFKSSASAAFVAMALSRDPFRDAFSSCIVAGLVLGAVVYGVSTAGGDVAWSLWTTKVAPPDRVADYMAVHTFLTGVRGVLAPMAAFWAVERLPPSQMGWAAALMIVAAAALLLPEIRRGRPTPT